ncbi:MAG: metallophosphatase family protein [Nitrospirae bacterium]|nr:metallophosphatase family protein [Nitrospirota bacterium]MCL5423107.1 metallophosphatase family protein [Nitrospirota bacterium]
MKLGILGDIHGNIEALKAVCETAVLQKVDKLYHLGDVGGYAPFVNEVVDFLVEHKIEGVQGNYDEAVGNNKEHCGCRYENPLQEEMAALAFEWTKKHASGKSKEYMRSLPFEIAFSCHGRTVKIFHATPLKNNLYWHQDRKDKFFLEMADKAKAGILIYGHTHIPYRRDVDGKVFINAGSVGKPKDGDTRACLTLVECLPEGVKTDFIRAPYDLERVASAIGESGLPVYFAERVREGK